MIALGNQASAPDIMEDILRKIARLAVSTVLALTGAGMAIVGFAGAASAHTPVVSHTCNSLSVNLTNYKPQVFVTNHDYQHHSSLSLSKTNHLTVQINSATKVDEDFGASDSFSWANPDSASSYTYDVNVTAYDDPTGSHGWTVHYSGTQSGCVTTVPVPGSPSVNPPTCESNGTVTLPVDSDSVHWSETIDGLTHTVVATAQHGYVFAGGSTTATFVLTVQGAGNGLDCTTHVHGIQPEANGAVCTGPGESGDGTIIVTAVEGIVYHLDAVDGPVINGSISASPGQHTVYAVAVNDSYTVDEPLSFTVSVSDAGRCIVFVTPVAPSVEQASCDGGELVGGSIHLTTVEGIEYFLGNSDTAVNGDVTDLAPGEYTVRAVADEGYSLGESSGVFTVTINDLTCEVAPTPTPTVTPTTPVTTPVTTPPVVTTPVTPPGPSLPFTGGSQGSLIDAGLLFIVLGFIFGAVGFTRKRAH